MRRRERKRYMRREVRSVRVQREEVRSDKKEGDREMVGKNEERGIKRG